MQDREALVRTLGFNPEKLAKNEEITKILDEIVKGLGGKTDMKDIKPGEIIAAIKKNGMKPKKFMQMLKRGGDAPKTEPRKKKTAVNAKCPCGSGQKFKKCCRKN